MGAKLKVPGEFFSSRLRLQGYLGCNNALAAAGDAFIAPGLTADARAGVPPPRLVLLAAGEAQNASLNSPQILRWSVDS